MFTSSYLFTAPTIRGIHFTSRMVTLSDRLSRADGTHLAAVTTNISTQPERCLSGGTELDTTYFYSSTNHSALKSQDSAYSATGLLLLLIPVTDLNPLTPNMNPSPSAQIRLTPASSMGR